MKQLLKTLKTTHPTKKQKKRPFRESEIKLIFQAIQPSSIDSLLVRCILAFAICGALRGSEYTVPIKTATGIQAVNAVKKQKIHRFIDATGNKSMVYVFFKSKTNQLWEAEYAVMPCCCKEKLPCAYHELERLESYISNLSDSTYLFTWSDGTLVTYNEALAVCKKAAALVGAKWEDIGTHSARKARTVMAVRRGLTQEAILLIGRWKSFESIIPYLDMGPLEFSAHLSQHFSSHHSSIRKNQNNTTLIQSSIKSKHR